MNVKQTLEALAPGARTQGSIAVGTMASGAQIAIPFVAVRGAADGPCLWINGQVHGNEINGIFAALDFFNAIDPARLRGTVVVNATGNPLALDARRKTAPQDEQDLDQSYPGRASGFTTERLAHALFAEAAACASVLINMHTLSHPFEARPYAVYKLHPGGKVKEETLLRMAAAFHPSVACRMSVEPGRGELPGNIAGGLDYQMLNAGIPAFMIELGAGSRAEPDYIRQGVEGFRGVARQMGLLESGPPGAATLRRVTRRTHVTFSHGGLFRTRRAPGEVVKAGEPLGDLIDLWGRTVETPSLGYDCIVIGIRRDPVVHTGDRVGFVAQEWDEIPAP